MNHYQLPNLELWQCRPDADIGDYFCHNIEPLDLEKDVLRTKQFALLGFACDLGIQRNFGRPGAKAAPDAIRKCLSRLTIPKINPCYDCGNIVVDDLDSLLSGQKMLANSVSKIVEAQITPIVLGGGHETAYGHYLGLMNTKNADIAIINFDAHFDLRPVLANGEGNSGTPFRQIYNLCSQRGRNFNYYCVGIQPHSNINSLYEFAKVSKTTYLEASVVNNNPQLVLDLVDKILALHKHIYITICLDAFHYSYAPGVSAPQALGIKPNVVIDAIRILGKSKQVLSLDIVELNPNLDIDNHTARLAANLIAEFYYIK